MRRRSFLLLLFLGCASPAAPPVVLPPGELLEASARLYRPGDRLLLQAGAEYRGTLALRVAGGGDPERPVEIRSDGEPPATILAGDGEGIVLTDSGVHVSHLRLKGSGRGRGPSCGVRISNARPGGDKRSGLRISGLEISGFSRAGIMVESGPPDRSDSGFRDVVIEDCKVYNGVSYGIWSSGPEQPKGSWKYPHSGIVVRGCEVFGISGDPAKHDNHSGNGILIGSVDGALIERCCAHDNGARNGSRHGGPVGIWTYSARKVVIRRCESYGNRSGERPVDGGGFDLDGGTTESLLEYNYSHDNDGAGYLVYSYKDAPHEFRDNIVRFNVSLYDGRRGDYGGIVVGQHDSQNVHSLIYHNLVAVRPQGDAKACALVTAQTRDLQVYNNVFLVHPGAFLLGTWGLPPGGGLQLAGNTWLVEGEPALLQGPARCGSLEEWIRRGGLEGAARENRVIPRVGKTAEEAPTLWPRDVSALKATILPEPDQVSPVDLSQQGVRGIPSSDFCGRRIVTSRFAGPFAPP
jgi:hypothetical protein